MSVTFTATYSAEDDKLRLYADRRFDDELWQRMKKIGFRWAPKQELFFAVWNPTREDLCNELIDDDDEIQAEETTLVERAEAKAARLDNLAFKRQRQASSYLAAADAISERFYMGQPILRGHHSERSARRDQQRMHNATRKGIDCLKAVNYWNYRAEGVERFANMKASPRTIANRIERILKELRDVQRSINHAEKCVEIWTEILAMDDGEGFEKKVEFWAGNRIDTGSLAYWGAWSDVTDGKVAHREMAEKTLAMWERELTGDKKPRWIIHLLNRLAFERPRLGSVQRFSGDLTPAILQTFARKFGAEKPKATRDCDAWTITSGVTLPIPIANDASVTKSVDEWKDTMVNLGYEVPVVVRRSSSKAARSSLINPTREHAERLQAIWNEKHTASSRNGTTSTTEITEMTQAQYSARSGRDTGYETVSLDAECNELRYRRDLENSTPVCRIRVRTAGMGYYKAHSVIIITDKKAGGLPVFEEETA